MSVNFFDQSNRKASGVLETGNLNSAPNRMREKPTVDGAGVKDQTSRARKIIAGIESVRIPVFSDMLERVRKRYRSGGMSL